MPKRVQRTRKAGQPGIPEGAVYVGRGPGSKWGNPFKAYDNSRKERRTATLLFANLLYTRGEPPYAQHTVPYPTDEEIRTELAGKDLACWCKPPADGQPDWCHAAVLLEWLERQDPWGVYCPHGKQIVERNPELTDPEGQPVGRIVPPWPCTVDGCTLERFEADQQAQEDDYWDGINALIADQYR